MWVLIQPQEVPAPKMAAALAPVLSVVGAHQLVLPVWEPPRVLPTNPLAAGVSQS